MGATEQLPRNSEIKVFTLTNQICLSFIVQPFSRNGTLWQGAVSGTRIAISASNVKIDALRKKKALIIHMWLVFFDKGEIRAAWIGNTVLEIEIDIQ